MSTLTFDMPTLAPMRINARLDSGAAQQLQYIMARTGMAMSDALRAGLALLYKDTRKVEPEKKSVLDSLVGKYNSGDPDLARDYKELYADLLVKKHGLNYPKSEATLRREKIASQKAKQK